MKIIKVAILIGILYLSGRACAKAQSNGHVILKAVTIDDKKYWQKHDPIMFLDTLKKHPEHVFIVSALPDSHWLHKRYRKRLLKFAGDSSVCGKVMSMYESNRPSAPSRVDDEVSKMLTGIRTGKYLKLGN